MESGWLRSALLHRVVTFSTRFGLPVVRNSGGLPMAAVVGDEQRQPSRGGALHQRGSFHLKRRVVLSCEKDELQDFIEKQKAYFKEVDGFKLAKEEVESFDELD